MSSFVLRQYRREYEILRETRELTRQLRHGFVEQLSLLLLTLWPFVSFLNVLVLILRSTAWLIYRLLRRCKLPCLRRALCKARIDNHIYIEVSVLLLFFGLTLIHVLLYTFQHGNISWIIPHFLWKFILWWIIIDILLAASKIVLLNQYRHRVSGMPVSINRSLILLLLNFLEIALCFSLLYLSSRSIGQETPFGVRFLMCPQQSFYFSIITITTLGYGDLRPMTDCGRILTIFEVMIGLYFVVLIFSHFVQLFRRPDDTP